ncbi:ATP-binding protein [Breoghania sp.]|uniref:ATP-binding protein n=1 Tax=Breoghania sp. TaxID=2065378 RepID=UPI0026094ABD|nr:ATP-binding protein [Breoghania sp.]MDJ0931561.1 ATP-binding protein [Breoghania sp.]
MKRLSPLAGAAHRLSFLKSPLRLYCIFAQWLRRHMPKGLFPRTILIIVLPMLLLQSFIAYLFMEKHWETVTQRLSQAVVGEIAATISVIEAYPQDANFETITQIANQDMRLSISVLPPAPLPSPRPKPFFSLLDRALSEEIRTQIGRPFWVDTVGRSKFVEIRIQLEHNVLRVITRRSQIYASNSHIFLVWMVSTSVVLLGVALLFLRNQIRPIQQLANAMESFGKGHPVEQFHPRGAEEVRRASTAFQRMSRRIERQIEQRTIMLAGVNHDLRTILTRFHLQLALIEESEETEDLRRDIKEMNSMLEAYLAFARGDGDELPSDVDISLMVEELEGDAEIGGATATSRFYGKPIARVKASAFRRCLTNLVANAARHGNRVDITGRHQFGWLSIVVEDDGPGIPEEDRETAFRPFQRLDAARNLDESGTGLGLTIARDIARGHGGDLTLEDNPLGGLRAEVRIPD